MRMTVVVLAIATGAVAWGAWQAQHGLRAWALARAEVQQWQQRSAQLQTEASAWQQRAQQVQRIERVMQDLRDSGLADGAWMQRHVRRADGPVSRAEAVSLLAEVGPSVPGQAVFVPEGFDLRVVSVVDGLLQAPGARDEGLQLAYAGQWWWREALASSVNQGSQP